MGCILSPLASCDQQDIFLATPLSALINRSVAHETYLSILKLAKIIPIHKSNDESDQSNYRPISLLSVFNRIFEKIMYTRLKSFLEKFSILYDSQHAFREKRSTEHAILEITNQIQTNMDRKLYTCVILIYKKLLIQSTTQYF